MCDGDPADSEILRLVKAQRVMSDKLATTLPGLFEEGDLYLSVLNGGTGAGDPIERDPGRIEDDLNGDYLMLKYAESIYGAVVEKQNGRYGVDRQKTQEKRQAIREKRQKESVSVKEWMDSEREKIRSAAFIKPVREMYRSSMATSESWAREYKDFWNLPDDFEMCE